MSKLLKLADWTSPKVGGMLLLAEAWDFNQFAATNTVACRAPVRALYTLPLYRGLAGPAKCFGPVGATANRSV